jgi:hypothetical protein
LFIRGWTVGSIPPFSYYQYCCNKHLCSSFCIDISFHFTWLHTYR